MTALDIEQPDALRHYLAQRGWIAPDETPAVTVLRGGVSNRTVRVDRASGESWVVKQALPRLRVKEEWTCDPARIRREALGLQWLERLVPGSVPGFVFEDPDHWLLGMRSVPVPHENWKTLLLAGGLVDRHARAFGRLLGTIHERSRAQRVALPAEFADGAFFEALRLEPYYRCSARRNPAVAGFLEALIRDTLAAPLCLVHGDYSPKNVLLHDDRLVLLDHEVIHVGDPAFDLGFAFTHLLSKAHHLPTQRPAFLAAAAGCWDAYRAAAPGLAALPGLEQRAVCHTLACLLARVDGRSPLDYLTEPERVALRRLVLALAPDPPAFLAALITAFGRALGAGAGG